MSDETKQFNLEINAALVEKFAELAGEGSMLQAGRTSHQSNNINNGFDEVLEG